MPTPLPPDNSAYSDSPAGLCFGSNTSQKKTYELCLKDSSWIPVSLFPAFPPVSLKVLTDLCCSSWHLENSDSPSQKSQRRHS